MVADAVKQQVPPQAPAAELFTAAQRHHRAGRLAEAEALFRRILAGNPRHAGALHSLGIVNAQRGDYAEAETCFRDAIGAAPELAEAHANLANLLRLQGRADAAAASYRRALAINPEHWGAQLGLAQVLKAQGRVDEALACYRQAAALRPDDVEAVGGLGAALQAAGKLDEAVAQYRYAVKLKPDYAEAHNNLGVALNALGRAEEALPSYGRALALRPNFAEAHNNLGNALRALGRHDEALSSYRRALLLTPDDAEAHYNLATTLQAQQKLEEAASAYRQALALKPDLAAAHLNLGNVRRAQNRLDEAVAAYRGVMAIDPGHAEALGNIGNILREQGRLEDALATQQQVLALAPNNASAHLNLGLALEALGRLTEAEANYRRALALKPNFAGAYNNLANALTLQGRALDAASLFRRAVDLQPDLLLAFSNLLFCQQHNLTLTPGALLLEHQAYGGRTAAAAAPVHANARDPEKRLNIGYVSPDLRQHPVGFFLKPVLAAHDRSRFAVHCYYGYPREDDLTRALKTEAEVWRSSVGVGDDELAAMIRADDIDILIDLAGHTARNRLPVFARRPAPVQVSWAGYVGTTGMAAIDYLITDRWESPPGSERYAVERLVRLPHGYLCYAPPDYAPAVGPLPAAATGAVTFGCFNNVTKLNPQVIALWSRLLHELPQSRLVLKSHALGDAGVAERFRALFAVEGIPASRVELAGFSPHRELLERYNDIDIALDPFPYSGGLTTIEALWMGVPVVTLGGDRFASRHSMSHLHTVGLGELVAEDARSYLAIAAALAGDQVRLGSLRTGLRERVRASPLLDGPGFTRGLEAALRAMWQTWCRAPGGFG